MSVIPNLQYLGCTESLSGHTVLVSLHYVGGHPGQERHGVQDGAVRHAATLGLSEISTQFRENRTEGGGVCYLSARCEMRLGGTTASLP